MTDHAAEVAELVARQLGRHQIGLHDRLIEDLGASSFDIVTIIAVLEESYGVGLDEERLPLLRTVADLASELARLSAPG
jgi:acyl carrier protein